MNRSRIDVAAILAADTDHAIELAPRIWWVGHKQDNDPFQCHAYLIEQGENSVLIDPGSMRTFEHTRRKIEEVIPFSHIKHILCQHQDPDITAALPTLEGMVRPGTQIVTHWRVQMIIKHYGVDLPTYLIDKNDWELQLEDRKLRFIFTPYAHFPGAFTTFDPVSGILFSSDLFGGLTKGFQLMAEDESYFEAMRPFHEHYIPTREILQFAIDEIRPYPVSMVAPQHGCLIPPHLVRRIMDRLYTLDTGLYLLDSHNTDIQRLSKLNESLRAVVKAVTMTREFKDIAVRLMGICEQWLPVQRLEFWSIGSDEGALLLAPESHYRGVHEQPPADVAELLGSGWQAWQDGPDGRTGFHIHVEGDLRRVLVPLSSGKQSIDGVAVMGMSAYPENLELLQQLIERLTEPLGVALERETMLRDLEEKREAIYQRSIRDPLTQLYTRIYMQDAAGRMCRLQDRGKGEPVCVALLDIDHFKSVNDTFGHNMGDKVLQDVSACMIEQTRQEVDIPVRLGGEELIVFSAGHDHDALFKMSERIRLAIAALEFPEPMHERQITVSIGTAIRKPGETLKQLIQRADEALYEAKETGRNQTIQAK